MAEAARDSVSQFIRRRVVVQSAYRDLGADKTLDFAWTPCGGDDGGADCKRLSRTH